MNRAVACVEVGLRCGFVARGRNADQAVERFWLHVRGHHHAELARWSPVDKAKLHDLVDALATSRRRPHHRRADTAPGLRELMASGDLRRWWA